MKPHCSQLSSLAVSLLLTAPLSAAVALQDGLTAYFNFEAGFANQAGAAGSNVAGTFVNGTPQNGATAGTPGGIAGNAMTLRPSGGSSNDYMNAAIGFGGTASITNLGTSFTISAWYRLDSPPAGSASGRYFVYEGANDFDVSYGLRDLNGSDDTTNGGINDGQFFQSTGVTVNNAGLPGWHNVIQIFTFNGTTTDISAYVDGVSLGNIFTGVSTAAIVDSGLNFGAPRSSVTDRGFDGQIDEIGLWNRVLTAEEINNANTGAAADSVFQLGLAGRAIPEPSAALLGGLGLLALIRRRRHSCCC